MSRDTMVYYRSFRESLRELPPDLYKVVSEKIFDYAFEGIAPGPDSNAVAKALFIAIKPVLIMRITDTMLVWRMGEKVERPKEAGTIQAEKLSNLTKDLTSTLTKNLTFIRIRM